MFVGGHRKRFSGQEYSLLQYCLRSACGVRLDPLILPDYGEQDGQDVADAQLLPLVSVSLTQLPVRLLPENETIPGEL